MAIQNTLQHESSTKSGAPAPSRNALYFIYLPPGITIIQGGSASRTGSCGDHGDLRSQIILR